MLPTKTIPQILQYPYNYQCASHSFQLLQNSSCTVWFPSITRICPCSENSLAPASPCPPTPPSFSHLKERRRADGLPLKPQGPACTLPRLSWVTRKRYLTFLCLSDLPCTAGEIILTSQCPAGWEQLMESFWHIERAQQLQLLLL